MSIFDSMRETMIKLWNERPLRLILFLALFFRLLAVVFSKGYGMHDDHFLVIESSQSWVDGYDYNDWLPSSNNGKINPSGHSFTYCGLHYLFFSGLRSIGITDAQTKMYFVRLLHALLSLLVVYYGYRITEKLAGMRTARTAGLLLALYFFMPMLSVRNLVEMACIPFLLYPAWMVIERDEKLSPLLWLLAGLILGFAFNIRFQSILFTAGFGLALLLRKKWMGAILTGVGFLVCAAGVQGITDTIIWGQPFVEFKEYVKYNMENAAAYSTKAWYMYFTVLGGLLIPPVSLFLLFGFFRSWKKYLLLFLPSFVFFAFHSYFPNKQERFILPIFPFVIILGMIGWNEFIAASSFWEKRKRMLRGCWIFFWILNCIPLFFISVAYSKRNKVEPMSWLSEKGDVKGFIVENGDSPDQPLMPMYYLERWVHEFYVNRDVSPAAFADMMKITDDKLKPNYVIFVNAENIDVRVSKMRTVFPEMKYLATVEPSFIDKVMHWLNPKNNQNVTCYIYSILIPTGKG